MRLVTKEELMVVCTKLRTARHTNKVPGVKNESHRVKNESSRKNRIKYTNNTHHRFNFLVKLLYFDFLGKNLGITFSAKSFRFLIMKARPCGSQQMASEFLSSERIDISLCGKMNWQSSSCFSSSSSSSSVTFSSALTLDSVSSSLALIVFDGLFCAFYAAVDVSRLDLCEIRCPLLRFEVQQGRDACNVVSRIYLIAQRKEFDVGRFST